MLRLLAHQHKWELNMTQSEHSEQSFMGRPPEAEQARELIIEQNQLRYLTALALMDGTVIGDQVRSAVSVYGASPYELRFLLTPEDRDKLSANPSYRLPGRKIQIKYTPEELEGYEALEEQATQQGLDVSIGLFAVLRKYIATRRSDPDLKTKVEIAIEHYRRELAES